ncbi:resolvase [Xenorhabdus thailandensis]|uniref:resolvase n=1 Tax=Xenorhabdus thailandensis TaxID=3136255 RepID=UPI0030F3A5E8
MMVQILAEAERERILERTNEGRQFAKESGVKFGRKPHRSAVQAKNMIIQEASMKEVMERTGISRATYFGVLCRNRRNFRHQGLGVF